MDNLLAIAIDVAIASTMIGFLFAFIRLTIGPTLADRVVALDLIAFLVIAFICVYAIDTNTESLLDIAITLALVAFLSTLAFARFIMVSKSPEKKPKS